MRNLEKVWRFVTTFLIYFALCAFVITCSFLLFFSGIELPKEQIRTAALATFINVLFLTVLFVTLDIIRRKITIDKPVKEIKDALQKITDGDFSVRLSPQRADENFAAIMESINRMTEELSGVETLRTDFIANVSHEMKTPLTVIQNYGTLLQDSSLSDEKRIEYAETVTNSSRRLADLITNILKLNRLENQQIYPKAENYDLGEQLCECLLAYENVWDEKGIEIETDIAENVTVSADRELLTLVWNNLFSNAFKFTEKGRVSLSLTATEGHATVKISDTGCGMSPDVGAHIFEKFYQGDSSHASAGNGLGLALVKRVIDIVKGEISVESEAGEGSTFTVRIRRN